MILRCHSVPCLGAWPWCGPWAPCYIHGYAGRWSLAVGGAKPAAPGVQGSTGVGELQFKEEDRKGEEGRKQWSGRLSIAPAANRHLPTRVLCRKARDTGVPEGGRVGVGRRSVSWWRPGQYELGVGPWLWEQRKVTAVCSVLSWGEGPGICARLTMLQSWSRG